MKDACLVSSRWQRQIWIDHAITADPTWHLEATYEDTKLSDNKAACFAFTAGMGGKRPATSILRYYMLPLPLMRFCWFPAASLDSSHSQACARASELSAMAPARPGPFQLRICVKNPRAQRDLTVGRPALELADLPFSFLCPQSRPAHLRKLRGSVRLVSIQRPSADGLTLPLAPRPERRGAMPKTSSSPCQAGRRSKQLLGQKIPASGN